MLNVLCSGDCVVIVRWLQYWEYWFVYSLVLEMWRLGHFRLSPHFHVSVKLILQSRTSYCINNACSRFPYTIKGLLCLINLLWVLERTDSCHGQVTFWVSLTFSCGNFKLFCKGACPMQTLQIDHAVFRSDALTCLKGTATTSCKEGTCF